GNGPSLAVQLIGETILALQAPYASAGDGGSATPGTIGGIAEGGGFYDIGGDLTISGSTFTGNSATSGAGGAGAFGGGIGLLLTGNPVGGPAAPSFTFPTTKIAAAGTTLLSFASTTGISAGWLVSGV